MGTEGAVFLKSTSPITFLDSSPSSKTKSFLKYLLILFDNKIGEVRKLVKIPEEGIDIKQYVGKNLEDTPPMNGEFVSLFFKILPVNTLTSINASKDFQTQVILFIVFNALLEVEYMNDMFVQKFEFVAGKKNISSRLLELEGRELGAILTPFQTSKQKVREWIDENWDECMKEMDAYEEESIEPLKLYKDFEYAIEITSLKNEGKSFSEICEILHDKYPKVKRLNDENSVKSIYYRHHKRLQNLKKTLPIK